MKQKERNWFKKHPKITIGIVVWIVLVFFAIILVSIDEPSTDNNQNAPDTPQNNADNLDSNPKIIEQQMEKDAIKILGSSNRKVDRLKEFHYSDVNGGVISIKFNINDNLNINYIRDGALMDSNKLFKLFYTKYSEKVSVVQMMGFYPLSDAYGNEEEVIVLEIKLKKETADKINWDNFDWRNLKTIADYYYIHPALLE